MTDARKPVDRVERLEEELALVRAAQKTYAEFTQEQVDRIFFAAAMAAGKMRLPLAKMAVEETGMGVVEDKVIKNHFASEYIYNAYRDVKTCGVIEEDKAYGITPPGRASGRDRGRDSHHQPHLHGHFQDAGLPENPQRHHHLPPPARQEVHRRGRAQVVLEAAVAAGAPEHIIAWIDVPSLEMTNLIMCECDMHRWPPAARAWCSAAYSSGKPALGVGAGNAPAVIDDSADILLAVNSIIHSKTFDNGMICASEQSGDRARRASTTRCAHEFAARGCYFLKGEELDKVRKTIIINGALNAKIVGQPAQHDRQAGRSGRPDEHYKMLIGEVEIAWISARSLPTRSSPRCWPCTAPRTLTTPWPRRSSLIEDGGYGHTASRLPQPQHPEAKSSCSFADADEDLPHRGQHPLLPGRHRRSVQLQAGPLPHPGLRLLGRQLRQRKRWREAPAQHQDRRREEREHAVVPRA